MSRLSAVSISPSAPRYKRSFKNYIVDSRFQLRYTGYIIAIALVISSVLGAFLVRTSQKVVAQGQQVVAESKKVSDILAVQISKDPIYGSDPELAKAFTAESTNAGNGVAARQEALAAEQRTMMRALVGGLGLMVVLIGLLGIYFTHKVAGPVYKMKLLLTAVGNDKLNFQSKLRKGDELQDFFETFATMVEKLKARQAREVADLDAAIAAAKESGASAEAIAKIAGVRDEMKASLEG